MDTCSVQINMARDAASTGTPPMADCKEKNKVHFLSSPSSSSFYAGRKKINKGHTRKRLWNRDRGRENVNTLRNLRYDDAGSIIVFPYLICYRLTNKLYNTCRKNLIEVATAWRRSLSTAGGPSRSPQVGMEIYPNMSGREERSFETRILKALFS